MRGLYCHDARVVAAKKKYNCYLNLHRINVSALLRVNSIKGPDEPIVSHGALFPQGSFPRELSSYTDTQKVLFFNITDWERILGFECAWVYWYWLMYCTDCSWKMRTRMREREWSRRRKGEGCCPARTWQWPLARRWSSYEWTRTPRENGSYKTKVAIVSWSFFL